MYQDCPRDPNPRTTIRNWAEEMDRLDSVKKKKKDNSSSEVDMQFKSINLLADRLGDTNAFAMDCFSSPPSSCSNTGRDIQSEIEFFRDIMKCKDDLSFTNSKVRHRQNLLNISEIITKEMEQETRRKSRIKSRKSGLANSSNESKLNYSKQTPSQTPKPGNEITPSSKFRTLPESHSPSRKSFSLATTPRAVVSKK